MIMNEKRGNKKRVRKINELCIKGRMRKRERERKNKIEKRIEIEREKGEKKSSALKGRVFES